MSSSPRRLRRIAGALGVLIFVGCLAGCAGGGSTAGTTTSSTTTSTTMPEALWVGQATVWLTAHGDDLKAISASAKELGDAAASGSNQGSEAAVRKFLVHVGKADGDLQANQFGHDLHLVFIDYATALSTILKGILNNDQATFTTGTDALAAAVAEFAKITDRLKAAP